MLPEEPVLHLRLQRKWRRLRLQIKSVQQSAVSRLQQIIGAEALQPGGFIFTFRMDFCLEKQCTVTPFIEFSLSNFGSSSGSKLLTVIELTEPYFFFFPTTFL